MADNGVRLTRQRRAMGPVQTANRTAKTAEMPVPPPKGVRPRRRRGPLHAFGRKLAVTGRNPDYVYRWFVDRDSRIKNKFDEDWDFVTEKAGGEHAISDDPGTNLSQVANKTQGGQRLYLMAKPRAYYDEDQHERQRRLDAVDEAIFRNRRADGAGRHQTLPTAEDEVAGQFYLPTSSPRHMVKGE